LQELFRELRLFDGMALFTMEEAKEIFGETYEFMKRFSPQAKTQTPAEAGLKLEGLMYAPPIILPTISSSDLKTFVRVINEVLQNETPVVSTMEDALKLIFKQEKEPDVTQAILALSQDDERVSDINNGFKFSQRQQKTAQVFMTWEMLPGILRKDPRIYTKEQLLHVDTIDMEGFKSFLQSTKGPQTISRNKKDLAKKEQETGISLKDIIGERAYKTLPDMIHPYKHIWSQIQSKNIPIVMSQPEFANQIVPLFQEPQTTVKESSVINALRRYVKQEDRRLSPTFLEDIEKTLWEAKDKKVLDYALTELPTPPPGERRDPSLRPERDRWVEKDPKLPIDVIPDEEARMKRFFAEDIDVDTALNTIGDAIQKANRLPYRIHEFISLHKYWPAGVLQWIADLPDAPAILRDTVEVLYDTDRTIYKKEGLPEFIVAPIVGGGKYTEKRKSQRHHLPGRLDDTAGWFRFRPLELVKEKKKVWFANEIQFDAFQRGTGALSAEANESLYAAMVTTMQDVIKQAQRNNISEVWIPPAFYLQARDSGIGEVLEANADIFGLKSNIVRVTREDVKAAGKQVPSTWIAEYEDVMQDVATKMGLQIKTEHPGAYLTMEVICGAGGTYSAAPVIEEVQKITVPGQQKESRKLARRLIKRIAEHNPILVEQHRVKSILARKHGVDLSQVHVKLPLQLSKWQDEHTANINGKIVKFAIEINENGIQVKG
jgi:hypothetical protein